MQVDFAEKVKNKISEERLSAYQEKLKSTKKIELFSHYIWNMVLSESLYSGLHILEITLRNTIHSSATKHFKGDDWLLRKDIISGNYEIKELEKAQKKIERGKKEVSPGRIIAELRFGFWTSLFNARYEQILWRHIIKRAFPYMPNRIRTRKMLSKRLNEIRDLRNRVFHHEPIWYWNLRQKHNEILDTISWAEPAMREFVMANNNFLQTYEYGLQKIEINLKQFF